jgi:hypothetical protein
MQPLSSEEEDMSTVPVTYHGEEFDGYVVNRKGDILNTRTMHYIKASPDKTCLYPRVTIKTKTGKYKKVLVHRIVAEAFIPLKRPQNCNITKQDWDNTPESVKKFLMKNMIVNHIDHNKENYYYKNLEWVTQEENARARNKFYGV